MARKADTSDIRPGDEWNDSIGVVRVMAVAEGYVMYRRRGCAPAVAHHTLFRKVHRSPRPTMLYCKTHKLSHATGTCPLCRIGAAA